jgi:hypothetical protein
MDRLGLGKLAILDGDPGLGKSLITLDLCARLSTGRPFPDGSPSPGPASSIVLNGEDGPEDTVARRLHALGADLDRVFVMRSEAGEPPLRFPSQVALLASAVAQTHAKLVVIDPIMAFLDQRISSASDHLVRFALLPLVQLAEEHACVILLVRHLNKTGRSHSLYRGGGSIGLIGACRSAWLVAPDPQVPQRRVLAQVKNNLAPLQTSLHYEFPSQKSDPLTVSWLGPCSWTADQLLARQRPGPSHSPRERAREFLAACLEKGPRTSRDIWAEAQPLDLTEATLQRAKHDLEARSVRVWANGQRLSYWLLPGQTLPDSTPSEDTESTDLEPWLAPLRQQFPPATPLDDL